MATCGHCHKTGQTVAHVRTCGTSAVATAERQLPDMEPGMAFTVDLEDGYWLVEAMLVGDQVQACRLDPTNRVVVWPLMQVEMVFPSAQAAKDYDMALRQQTTRERVSETLHGDPHHCRGCAKGWRGAKWHRADCPVASGREEMVWHGGRWVRESLAPTQTAYGHEPASQQTRENQDSPWAAVDALRQRIKPHLNRETKRGKVRHFALGPDDAAKFYRVKETPNGRVYVDAIAGGSQREHDGVSYPVKTPATLVQVLTEILVDPDLAAARYGQLLTRCSDCNRTLTDATSRELGIGPECRSKC